MPPGADETPASPGYEGARSPPVRRLERGQREIPDLEDATLLLREGSRNWPVANVDGHQDAIRWTGGAAAGLAVRPCAVFSQSDGLRTSCQAAL